MARTQAKVKKPSIKEGVELTASALKDDAMWLIETGLKKLEHGLAALEKVVHQSRTHAVEKNQKNKNTVFNETKKSVSKLKQSAKRIGKKMAKGDSTQRAKTKAKRHT